MERNILAVGDVVAPAGVKYCKAALPRLRRELSVDFCVVNGENAAVLGMLPAQAEELLSAGADVITMGNHTWGRRELVPYLERSREVLRPANLPQQQPGRADRRAGDAAVPDERAADEGRLRRASSRGTGRAARPHGQCA